MILSFFVRLRENHFVILSGLKMDNKKYDEHGRPIKSKSFFDSFSKPKKQNYSYRVEKKKEENDIDQQLEDGLKDYNREIDLDEETQEKNEGDLIGDEEEPLDKISADEVTTFLNKDRTALFLQALFLGPIIKTTLSTTIKRIERDYVDFTQKEQEKLNYIKRMNILAFSSMYVYIAIYFIVTNF
jgi:hypothetical protein